MTQPDTLINLRKRVMDAVKFGVLDENSKPLLETVLIQIVNEAERQKQKCDALNHEYTQKAAQASAQSSAYSSISSVVYAVLNGFVTAAEKSFILENEPKQEKRLSLEESEKLAEIMKRQEDNKHKEYVNTEFDKIIMPSETEQKEAISKIRKKVESLDSVVEEKNNSKDEEIVKIKKQLSKKKKS